MLHHRRRPLLHCPDCILQLVVFVIIVIAVVTVAGVAGVAVITDQPPGTEQQDLQYTHNNKNLNNNQQNRRRDHSYNTMMERQHRSAGSTDDDQQDYVVDTSNNNNDDNRTNDDDDNDDDDNAAADDNNNNNDDDDDGVVISDNNKNNNNNDMETTTTTTNRPCFDTTNIDKAATNVKNISIAFCGNSMLYFNDSPRLLELIITLQSLLLVSSSSSSSSQQQQRQQQPRIQVYQNSCLRGGATLSSLYTHGNGMTTKFHTVPATLQLSDVLPQIISILSSSSSLSSSLSSSTCVTTTETTAPPTETTTATPTTTTQRYQYHNDHTMKYDIGAHTVQQLLLFEQQQEQQQQQHNKYWDYIVLNDYTQGPARYDSRKRTQHTLLTKYVPIIPNPKQTTIIIIQTPAYYKMGIKDSTDLGNFQQFTSLLKEGTLSYVHTLQSTGKFRNVLLAPVGDAYLYLYQNNRSLYNKLYSWDHYHPSPHGTWLQVWVLYHIMFPKQSICTNAAAAAANDDQLQQQQLQQLQLPYHDSYWLYSRYMQPIDEDVLPKPTVQEAQELQRVACLVTNTEFVGLLEQQQLEQQSYQNDNDDDNNNDDV